VTVKNSVFCWKIFTIITPGGNNSANASEVLCPADISKLFMLNRNFGVTVDDFSQYCILSKSYLALRKTSEPISFFITLV